MICKTAQTLFFSLGLLCCIPYFGFVFGRTLEYNSLIGESIFFSAILFPTVMLFAGYRVAIIGAVSIAWFALWVISLWTSSQIMELTYDGQNYHMTAILALIKGWNPLFEELPYPYNTRAIWIEHYPQLLWQGQAVLAHLPSGIEGSKAFHYILILATALRLYDVFLHLGISKIWSILAAIACIGPIPVAQSYTFMNDGIVALSMMWLFISVWAFLNTKSKIELLMILLSLTILFGTKFSAAGMGLAALIGAAFIAIFYVPKTFFFKTSALILSLILIATILNTGSYIQNHLDHGHPFYPVKGEGNIDFMTENTPDSIKYLSWGQKRIAGLFLSGERHGELRSFDLHYFLQSRYIDSKPLGGFGPLWSSVALLGLISLAIWIRKAKRNEIRFALLISTPAILAFLIHPEGWWARYVAHIWLLPILFAVLIQNPRYGRFRAFGMSTILLALTQVSGAAGRQHFSYQTRAQEVQQVINTIEPNQTYASEAKGIGFIGSLSRIEAQGANIILFEDMPCQGSDIPWTYGNRTLCRIGITTDPGQPIRILPHSYTNY